MSKDTVRKTVEAIWPLTESRGIHPTVRKVQQQLGLNSASLADKRIREVQDRGPATTVEGIARSPRLVRKGETI